MKNPSLMCAVDPGAVADIDVAVDYNSNRKQTVEKRSEEGVRSDEATGKFDDIYVVEYDRNHSKAENAINANDLVDQSHDPFFPDDP